MSDALWGYHHLAYDTDDRDWGIFRAARSMTVFESWWRSPSYMTTALSVTAQDAPIFVRNWAEIDNPDRGQMQAMIDAPETTGARHADQWAEWLKDVGIPTHRLYCCPLNEPDTNQWGPQIDRYNAAFINRLWRTHHLKAGALMLSPGHPRTVGGRRDTLSDWSVFRATLAAIKESGSRLSLHEYGMPDNHGDDHGGYWVGRFTHLLNWLRGEDPWLADNIAIDITEHGIDLFIGDESKRHPSERGYRQAGVTPERYIEWLNYSHKLYSRYPQVKSVQVFTWGTDNSWGAFDMRPMRDLWERATWERLPTVWTSAQAKPPATSVHLPFVAKQQETEPMSSTAIDPYMAQAIMSIEAPAAFGPDGRLIIRFEAHIFKGELSNDGLFDRHFLVEPHRPWEKPQYWRTAPDQPWAVIHTGQQASEWAAFEQAAKLDRRAALRSISMGLPQVMGFNHARVGFATVEDMFEAFSDSRTGEAMQTLAFVNYVLTDPDLLAAFLSKDWRTIAAKYNGAGGVDRYAPLLQQAYNRIRNT